LYNDIMEDFVGGAGVGVMAMLLTGTEGAGFEGAGYEGAGFEGTGFEGAEFEGAAVKGKGTKTLSLGGGKFGDTARGLFDIGGGVIGGVLTGCWRAFSPLFTCSPVLFCFNRYFSFNHTPAA